MQASMHSRTLLEVIRSGEVPATRHRILQIAVSESRSLRCPFTGSEHLLCALIQMPDSRLEEFFARRKIDLEDVRSEIGVDILSPSEAHKAASDDFPTSTIRPVLRTPRLRRILGIAKRQSEQASHLTPSQSFLAAIIAEGRGTAISILKKLGFEQEELRTAFPESALPHEIPLFALKSGELVWFLDPKQNTEFPLALIMDAHGAGYVYGGLPGNRFAGHTESALLMCAEFFKDDYTWVPDLLWDKKIPEDWKPPDEEAKKDVIVARVISGGFCKEPRKRRTPRPESSGAVPELDAVRWQITSRLPPRVRWTVKEMSVDYEFSLAIKPLRPLTSADVAGCDFEPEWGRLCPFAYADHSEGGDARPYVCVHRDTGEVMGFDLERADMPEYLLNSNVEAFIRSFRRLDEALRLKTLAVRLLPELLAEIDPAAYERSEWNSLCQYLLKQ